MARIASRSRWGLLSTSTLGCALALSAPLAASFHIMQISEVMVGAGGDARIQFVELQMLAGGQNFIGGHRLYFFDAAGNAAGDFLIPSNVSRGNTNGFILFGTQEFADNSSVAPDFILSRPMLAPSGRVSFEGPSLAAAIDSVAYGAFTGANTGFGSPAPAPDTSAVLSLTRRSRTSNNTSDFANLTASPTNNAGQAGVVTPPPSCFFSDDFADTSAWDSPTPGAGVDLAACGIAAFADIGSIAVAGGALLLKPGAADMLGLGNPIALTGLKSSAVIDADFADQSYRLRFTMRASQGIADGAVFVRQHYGFDDDIGAFDLSTAAGFGINFGFDNVGETTDHLHADVRQPCLQEGRVDGEDEADFPGFLLESEKDFTVILDVDGNDRSGPLTLQVKLFPSEAEEPAGYLASFVLSAGLNAPSDLELDHGVLLAALGASGSSLAIRDFSVCPIPIDHLYVRNLVCTRNPDESVSITWQNPAEAKNEPIQIKVNGAPAGQVEGDKTSFVLSPPPAGDLLIEVINFSDVAVSCSVCENDPPVALIAGPTRGQLGAGDTLTVTLDSSASEDGEGGTQGFSSRLWTVIRQPEGATATLSDPLAAATSLTVDADGEYEVELELIDKGCNADGSDALSDKASHVLTVGGPVGPLFIRGDCNGDGRTSGVGDPVTMLTANFIGGVQILCKAACDANGDGGTTGVGDAVFLLTANFVGGLTVPAPFPNCGEGSAADAALGCGPTPGCP